MLFVNSYSLLLVLFLISLFFVSYLLITKNKEVKLNNFLKIILSLFVFISSGVMYYFAGSIVEINKLDKLQDSQKMVFAIISNLESIIKENPDDAKGWYLLGKMYLKINKDKEAFDALKNAYELDKDNVNYQVQYFWTKFMMTNKLSQDDIEILKKALKGNIKPKLRSDINNLLNELN